MREFVGDHSRNRSGHFPVHLSPCSSWKLARKSRLQGQDMIVAPLRLLFLVVVVVVFAVSDYGSAYFPAWEHCGVQVRVTVVRENGADYVGELPGRSGRDALRGWPNDVGRSDCAARGS